MQKTMSRDTYAAWLERQMREHGWTLRGLARAWNPDDPETARRALRRYLKGMVPIARTRRDLAEVIGCKETGPSPSDDDSKEDD